MGFDGLDDAVEELWLQYWRCNVPTALLVEPDVLLGGEDVGLIGSIRIGKGTRLVHMDHVILGRYGGERRRGARRGIARVRRARLAHR